MKGTREPNMQRSGVEAISPITAASSASNAVRHGLTAQKFIPAILEPGRVDVLAGQLEQELRPSSVTEKILVREIARHATMLELGEAAEPSVLRMGVASLAPMLASADGALPEDAALAAAVTTDSIERLTRYRRAHEKALHQALARLGELQAARHIRFGRNAETSFESFGSEDACRAQLRARFEADTWECPNCQSHDGHWLSGPEKWQCGSCRARIGLRDGTVFERSPLPLVVWFAAVGHVVGKPRIAAAELGRLLALKRPATAQSVLRRIRQAIHEDPTRLIGLDVYYRGFITSNSAPSVLFTPKLRNKSQVPNK